MMTREYIDSQVADSEIADDIEKCYRRWLQKYHSLFVGGNKDGQKKTFCAGNGG